jgi:poly(beta-D-mannuronate) lyase
MKYFSLSMLTLLFMWSCTPSIAVDTNVVSSNEELLSALANAQPGDHIVMADGIYEDIKIKITASGTEDKPITLSAASPGKVIIQGQSNLELGGEYLIIDGLYFTNGHSPSRAVIHFAVKDTVANHCIVRNCVVKDYNQLQRNHQDLWVVLKGRHNQLDHCYFAGKSNRGPTVRVDLEGNQNIKNYHQITNNHFGPRPPKGGPSAETIQIGNSYTSMSPSYTLVANNLFDECNGEVEVISSKTNFNEFRNNVFYKSEGSLVTRHGNYCTVDGNYFIGDESASNVGGVRLIGTGHTVTNNYFYNLRGKEFRSPLAVMNGIPKSPLNRYIQVTDVVVAHNTWVNCTSPLQFGVGSNVSQKDVLPASEIRSARPIRTILANNLVYNTDGDKTPIVAHDKLDGIIFKNNLINNQGVSFDQVEGVRSIDFEMKEIADYIMVPTSGLPEDDIYSGFGFEEFDKDLFGASREDNNAVGAVIGTPASAPPILDRSQYGADWFDISGDSGEPTIHTVSKGASLMETIAQAADGDQIVIEAGDYEITSSLKVNKTLIIKSKDANTQVNLKYTGTAKTALFEMNPNGFLTLINLRLSGNKGQYAFASLKESMSSLYNLTLDNCVVENFDYILKAYKYSFSEDIVLKNSTFKNCNNGIELSEETDDKGDYNAENITIDGCTFDNVAANVLDYYRGGYDESTVGGTLSVVNSTFTNSGSKEKNGILLNTYGIINVDISNNTFKNNRVQKVAQLWGAKNNTHSNNVITNSGKMVVEENLKLKTFY